MGQISFGDFAGRWVRFQPTLTLKNPADAKVFDAIYAEYVGDPLPARTLTQSDLMGFDVEVDAVLVRSQLHLT